MNRIKGSIFFSVFVAMLGLMLIAPIMPPLIRELGLKEGHSGLIISLGSITMALMAPVWGNLSDTKGRKLMILLGSLFLIAGMASFLISASLVVYYAVFFMFGIGTGLMMPRFRGGPN